MDEFTPWGCLEVSPQVDELIIKVHKWTSLLLKVHKWTSLLSSPQVDEFIPWGYFEIISLQMDKFIIKSISGQVHLMGVL